MLFLLLQRLNLLILDYSRAGYFCALAALVDLSYLIDPSRVSLMALKEFAAFAAAAAEAAQCLFLNGLSIWNNLYQVIISLIIGAIWACCKMVRLCFTFSSFNDLWSKLNEVFYAYTFLLPFLALFKEICCCIQWTHLIAYHVSHLSKKTSWGMVTGEAVEVMNKE